MLGIVKEAVRALHPGETKKHIKKNRQWLPNGESLLESAAFTLDGAHGIFDPIGAKRYVEKHIMGSRPEEQDPNTPT